MSSEGEPAASAAVDFFVSYARRDQAWAEWLAWQLTEAGYTVELDIWDWAPGQDFVAHTERALRRADRLLAVWTEAYFSTPLGAAEFRTAFSEHSWDARRIVPVLVEQAAIPELLRPLSYIDLVGLDEAPAADRLRARLAGGRPATPSAGEPAFPGSPSPPTGTFRERWVARERSTLTGHTDRVFAVAWGSWQTGRC